MANKKALFTWIITISLLAFIVLLSACKTSTEPEPEPEPGPEPIEKVGTKEFIFTIIHRETEAELIGYDIDIDGPVSASASGVSTAEYTLSDIVSGEYTITVSMDGFVNSQITEEIEVPEDESADFIFSSTISLRELSQPVVVNNSVNTSVKTGKPDVPDAEDDEAITLQIPANTFPAAVVKADGTVDISVTRVSPLQATQSDGGMVLESIIFGPEANLNNNVTITIPIPEFPGVDGLEYVLQPGNIPLTSVGGGNFQATIRPIEGVAPTANSRHIDMVAEFNSFRNYLVELKGLTLSITGTGFTDYQTYSSQCGRPLGVTVWAPEVTLPDRMRFESFRFLYVYEAERIAGRIIESSRPNRIVSVEARIATRTYTLSRGNEVLATVTVNLSSMDTKNAIRSPCPPHNSGGG